MRNYSSIASEKTLADPLTSSGTTVQISDVNGFPAAPFTLVIEPDTVREEIVTVTTVDGTQLTLSRGEEGTSAVAHDEGTTARHMITGRDLQDAQDHINSTENVHGIGDTAYLATLNGTQTLTNKTLTSPKINESTALTATATELNKLTGATVTTAELNRLVGVTSAVQDQLDTIINVTIPNSMPVGTIVMFGGTSAPTGWLLCNGQSTSGYSALATALGGAANVPDLRGRAPIGYGQGSGLTNRGTIGATVGAETHTLTKAETPSFSHELQYSESGGNGSTYFKTAGAPYSGSIFYSHGSGQAHNNMQPSTVVNFIIKY